MRGTYGSLSGGLGLWGYGGSWSGPEDFSVVCDDGSPDYFVFEVDAEAVLVAYGQEELPDISSNIPRDMNSGGRPW